MNRTGGNGMKRILFALMEDGSVVMAGEYKEYLR